MPADCIVTLEELQVGADSAIKGAEVSEASPMTTMAQPTPPATLLDVPAHILVQIVACCTLADASRLVSACRLMAQQLTQLKPVHAVAKALATKRKPGRRLNNECQQLLGRVRCTPAAVTWLRATGALPASAMLNPDMADWMMQYAGMQGEWRTVDWVLQLYDPAASTKTHKLYHQLWNRAWLSAAGHAAAGQHTALLAALMAQPCAPGQAAGLRQLTTELQAQLLCGAISGPDPAAALAAVYPLCMLPVERPRLPWEDPAPPDTRQGQRRKALLSAAEHAMRHGYTGAIAPLMALGLEFSAHVAELMHEALPRDQGDTLMHVLSLTDPADIQQRTVLVAKAHSVSRVWEAAVAGGKRHCLHAMMEAGAALFKPANITRLLGLANQPWAVDTAAALLSHPSTSSKVEAMRGDDKYLVDAVSSLAGGVAFTSLLLQHDFPPTHAALVAACKHGRPEVLQLLLTKAVHGQEQGLKLLKPAAVAAALLVAAQQHERAVGGLEHVRRRATLAGRCAQLLLDHLLLYCGAPPTLHRILMGYKASDAAWQQSCDATGCMEEEAGAGSWPVVLQALLLLRETKLVAAVLALPCLATLRADQCLLEQAAWSCAATPSRSPMLLVELVRRGAQATAALQAVVKTLDIKLLLNVLAAFRSEHVLSTPESASSGFMGGSDVKSTQTLTPGWEDDWTVWAAASTAGWWGMDLTGLQWAEQAAQHAAQRAAATGCTTASEVLRLLIVHHGVAASAGLVIPGVEGQARSKHHYAHLKWLLHLAGAEHLRFSKATAVKSVADTYMSAAEQLARWAPLPFVVLAATHRVSPMLLLAGLCQRPQPPLHLISQLLNGGASRASLARNPASQTNLPRAAVVPLLLTSPSPQANAWIPARPNWQDGSLLLYAMCGNSTELVDLLISAGATQYEAALTCPHANPALVLHMIEHHVQEVTLDALCVVIPGRQGRPSQAALRLLAAGVDPEQVLFAASKVGCVHTAALLVDIYGVDPSVFLDQPVVLAAQHGHQAVVELLVSRGASVHAALYGAVLGGAEHMVKYLMEAGADPQWDDGAAVNAAVVSNSTTLINLLLPE